MGKKGLLVFFTKFADPSLRIIVLSDSIGEMRDKVAKAAHFLTDQISRYLSFLVFINQSSN